MSGKNNKKFGNSPRLVFGASMSRQTIYEIDKIRGDTPRSLWLYRAAVKELERQRKEETKRSLQGATVSRPPHQAEAPTEVVEDTKEMLSLCK